MLYTTAPETGFCKPAVLLTFGNMTNLFAAEPADCKSTADPSSVLPIPTPPKQAVTLIPLISVSSNISVDLIETVSYTHLTLPTRIRV